MPSRRAASCSAVVTNNPLVGSSGRKQSAKKKPETFSGLPTRASPVTFFLHRPSTLVSPSLNPRIYGGA
jgi:hypothetical protein